MKKTTKIALLALFLTTTILAGYVIFNNFFTNNQTTSKSQSCGDSYVGCGDQCRLIEYYCISGTEAFYDGIGCGCKAIEPDPITSSTSTVHYIGRGKAECMAIDYECEPGTGHFNDDIGCGCK